MAGSAPGCTGEPGRYNSTKKAQTNNRTAADALVAASYPRGAEVMPGRTFLFTFFFRKVNSSRKRCAEGTTQ